MAIIFSCQTEYKYTSRNCTELGLVFKFPDEMKEMDSTSLKIVSDKGEKAEDEVFSDSETERIWTPACIKPLAGKKNVVFDMACISEKRILKDHETYKAFIDYFFEERAYFMKSRFQSNEVSADALVETTKTIQIGDMTVEKYKIIFDIQRSEKYIIDIIYLFRKNGLIYRMEYFGTNQKFSELMEHCIENPEPMK